MRISGPALRRCAAGHCRRHESRDGYPGWAGPDRSAARRAGGQELERIALRKHCCIMSQPYDDRCNTAVATRWEVAARANRGERIETLWEELITGCRS